MKKNVPYTPILLSCIFGITACGSSGSNDSGSSDNGDDDTGIIDSLAPAAAIAFPPALSATDSSSIIVTGTASDEGTITVVRVNGVDATSADNFATWQANVTLLAGVNTLTVETGDIALNSNDNAASVTISFNGSALLRPNAITVDVANNRALVVETPLSGGSKGIAAVNLSSGTRTTFSDATTPDAVNPFLFAGDVVIDDANNRVLVSDFRANTIFALDSTGARTVFSDNTTPDAVNPFASPTEMVLDSTSAQLFVLDSSNILSVNLSTGARSLVTDQLTFNSKNIALDSANSRLLVLDRVFDNEQIVVIDITPGGTFGDKTILTEDGLPDSLNELTDARSIEVDAVNNRALVVDRGINGIIAVNLDTGARTVMSNNTIPDALSPFSDLSGGIALDSANSRNRALVVDVATVIAIDLVTGARSPLTNTSTPDSINPFKQPFGVVFDLAGNRALVIDATLDAIVAVDVATGTRTILSDSVTPDGTNVLVTPLKIALDTGNNRALVLDETLAAIVAVSLADGTRTIFSDNSTPDANNPFSAPNGGIVFDSENNRTLVLDGTAVIAVDNSGARNIFSDSSTPDGNNPFLGPVGITIDSALNRALVADGSNQSIIAVNLANGTRTILSDASTPDTANVFNSLSSIEIDIANNRALVTDSGLDAIVAVDLTTGARTIVSNGTTPNSANDLITPRGLVLDSNTNNMLVVDSGLNALLAIDSLTGARVVLSK